MKTIELFQYAYMHYGNVLHVLNLYTVCTEIMYSVYIYFLLEIFGSKTDELGGNISCYFVF